MQRFFLRVMGSEMEDGWWRKSLIETIKAKDRKA